VKAKSQGFQTISGKRENKHSEWVGWENAFSAKKDEDKIWIGQQSVFPGETGKKKKLLTEVRNQSFADS